MFFPLLIVSALAANPCTNGSFEQLGPGGFPADWGPVGSVVEVASDAHSGRHSLRLVRVVEQEGRETGLNRGVLLDPLRGGVEFWYKAISAQQAKLCVYVIPMTAGRGESLGAGRATFTVPGEHVGDGRWHRGRLKYDFTATAEVVAVHFAARIISGPGEMLLDDFAYIEQVGPVARVVHLGLDEDPARPGLRAVLRATVENRGDVAAPFTAALELPAGVRVTPAETALGELKPDESKRCRWTLEGPRVAAGTIRVVARSTSAEGSDAILVAPKLSLRSFGPAQPVAAAGRPIDVECLLELENEGGAIVERPWAAFQLPDGTEEVRRLPALAPGRTVLVSVALTPAVQSASLPLAVQAGAENVPHKLRAASSLVVGSADAPPPPAGTLRAAVAPGAAVLENANIRLVFSRNAFGFGPGEISLPRGATATRVAWIARLGRLVWRSDSADRVEQTLFAPEAAAETHGATARLRLRSALRDGDGAAWAFTATFELGQDSRTIAAACELTCDRARRLLAFDGPMVYALRRDEAVVPGLEWLVGDEVSSSALDIAAAHPHRVRYAVHPNMITIPAIGVHGPDGTVGLLWDVHQKWDGRRDRPCAVFASPDRFENQRAHLMGLMLPTVPDFLEPNQREAASPYPMEPGKPLRLECRVFAAGPECDALTPIDEWVRLHGIVDPTPLPRGDHRREIEFSMRGYLDSLWQADERQWWTSKGGGELSLPGRPAMFAADLLLGALLSPSEDVRRRCRERAEEVAGLIRLPARIGALRFAARSDHALPSPAQVAGLLDALEADGSWRFDADQQGRGPFEGLDYHDLGPNNAVEIGTCAKNAYEVLRFARIAGDVELYRRLLPTLALMESFRVPRAAQVWEVQVHTPDVLAAADAIDAFLEAYQISGERRWLRDAVVWARRGLPFIYLWQDAEKPFLAGGSIAVFGASWYDCSWFGRPVQWNGLRYARALLKLAPLDPSCDWRKLAEAIVSSAAHQQDADGDNAALWPDNIDAITCKKCGWMFAPRQIITSLLALMDRAEEPATIILGQGDRRLHVTSTAAFSRGDWDGSRLDLGLAFPAGESGWVLVANVGRPAAVVVDGHPAPEDRDAERGDRVAWRYDPAQAFLTINVPHDGPTAVRVEGARFRAVDRVPRTLDRIAFEFDSTTEGWLAAHQVEDLDCRDGVLEGRITGGDPYIVRNQLRVPGDSCPVLDIRMRVSAGQSGQLFWSTFASPGFAEQRGLQFPVTADGQWHTYRVATGRHSQWAGQTITALRIDPSHGAGGADFAIDFVRTSAP